MTHFPTQRIDVMNAGIGGDIAMQIYERLDADVFSRKPTVVTVTFGMNDTGYQEYLRANAKETAEAKVKQAFNSYLLIEKKLQEYSKVRKILIASSPYDETSKIKTTAFPGKNAAMLRIADFQEESAKKNNWEFLDFNRPMVNINQRLQQKDSLFTLCGNDRIHPSNDGHFVMAYIFLEKQGFAGLTVAGINIDASTKKVIKAENCRITNLLATTNAISFDYLANSLPYPIDTIARGGSGGMNPKKQSDALAIIPFTESFNSETLIVGGLKETSNYLLKIDGVLIGKWKGSDYTKGINMALLTGTPQYQQSLSIMALNEERWELERRLREYYWLHFSILKKKGLLFNDSESTFDSVKVYARRDIFVRGVMGTYQKARFENVRQAWQKEMDVLVDQIYTINKPKKHKIEIDLVE